MPNLVELITQLGWPLALLLFFVWQSYRDKATITRRLTEVEDYQRNRLEALAVETTVALQENTQAHRDLREILQTRPCIANQVQAAQIEGAREP